MDAAIKSAKHVVTRECRMNRQTPDAARRACLPRPQDRRHRTRSLVYVSHQLPVPVQIGLANFLGLQPAAPSGDFAGCRRRIRPQDISRRGDRRCHLGGVAARAAGPLDPGPVRAPGLRRELPGSLVSHHRATPTRRASFWASTARPGATPAPTRPGPGPPGSRRVPHPATCRGPTTYRRCGRAP